MKILNDAKALKNGFSFSHSADLAIVVFTFVVLGCVCSNTKHTEMQNSKSIEITKQVSPLPTSSTPPNPKPASTPFDENSPDYKEGYAKGLNAGKEFTKANIPQQNIEPQMVEKIAGFQAEDAKPQPNDVAAFRAGFIQGFTEGFKSKSISPNLERLSWDNAKAGVKLYDSNGKQVAIIVVVDEPAGMITVKYGKEGGEVVENKYLEPLSKFWFVRK